jgi:hypothetical protein
MIQRCSLYIHTYPQLAKSPTVHTFHTCFRSRCIPRNRTVVVASHMSAAPQRGKQFSSTHTGRGTRGFDCPPFPCVRSLYTTLACPLAAMQESLSCRFLLSFLLLLPSAYALSGHSSDSSRAPAHARRAAKLQHSESASLELVDHDVSLTKRAQYNNARFTNFGSGVGNCGSAFTDSDFVCPDHLRFWLTSF